jgi:hypothetical protein
VPHDLPLEKMADIEIEAVAKIESQRSRELRQVGGYA